jgi:uncharacterized protein YjbK
MERQDYLLKQTRDFGKFLAYLVGLAKKGDVAKGLEVTNQALGAHFGQDENFSEKHLNDLLNEGKIQPDDLKILGELLQKKAEFSPESAACLLDNARMVLQLYMNHTPVFDYATELKLRTWPQHTQQTTTQHPLQHDIR